MTRQEKESLLSHRRSSSVAGSSYGAIKYQSLDSRPNSNFMCTTRDSVVVSIAVVTTCVLISVTLAIGLPKIEERKLYIPRPSTTTQLKTNATTGGENFTTTQLQADTTTGAEAFTTTQLQADATTGAEVFTTIGRTSASTEANSATSRQEENSLEANATLLQGAPPATDKKKFVLFQQKCLRNCLYMDC